MLVLDKLGSFFFIYSTNFIMNDTRVMLLSTQPNDTCDYHQEQTSFLERRLQKVS